MENSYYNTNKEFGSDLKNSNNKAKSQEEAILKIFEDKIKLSASEVWNIFDYSGTTPITSIRRGITNLCIKGDLFKTEKTKKGIYGKKEHIYILSSVKK
jgi:hypothetical protein